MFLHGQHAVLGPPSEETTKASGLLTERALPHTHSWSSLDGSRAQLEQLTGSCLPHGISLCAEASCDLLFTRIFPSQPLAPSGGPCQSWRLSLIFSGYLTPRVAYCRMSSLSILCDSAEGPQFWGGSVPTSLLPVEEMESDDKEQPGCVSCLLLLLLAPALHFSGSPSAPDL